MAEDLYFPTAALRFVKRRVPEAQDRVGVADVAYGLITPAHDVRILQQRWVHRTPAMDGTRTAQWRDVPFADVYVQDSVVDAEDVL